MLTVGITRYGATLVANCQAEGTRLTSLAGALRYAFHDGVDPH